MQIKMKQRIPDVTVTSSNQHRNFSTARARSSLFSLWNESMPLFKPKPKFLYFESQSLSSLFQIARIQRVKNNPWFLDLATVLSFNPIAFQSSLDVGIRDEMDTERCQSIQRIETHDWMPCDARHSAGCCRTAGRPYFHSLAACHAGTRDFGRCIPCNVLLSGGWRQDDQLKTADER